HVAGFLGQTQEGDGVAHRSEPKRLVPAREMDLPLRPRMLRQEHAAIVAGCLDGRFGGRRRRDRRRFAVAGGQADAGEREREDRCDETLEPQADLLYQTDLLRKAMMASASGASIQAASAARNTGIGSAAASPGPA